MRDLYALGRHSLAGLATLILLTVLLGIGYPLAVTGVASVTMPWQARGSYVAEDGSRVTDTGEAVGSSLLGQATAEDPALFHGRPSAAGEGYDPLATAGSNLGPESPELVASIEDRRADIAVREGVEPGDVPADALTASASGLDPHISPAYAALQAPRVARETGLDEAAVRGLIAAHTTGRALGFLGEAGVNVLRLNLAVRSALE